MSKPLLFGLLAPPVAFAAGTLTLLGPVRWLAALARDSGWSDGAESAAVTMTIGVYGLVSAAIAWWLTCTVSRSTHGHVRLGIPALALLAAAGTVWLWMTPHVMGNSGVAVDVGSSFTFGPYPSEAEMARLRREGFTAVVSLLHPAVVPFETRLIAQGREAAGRIGLEYIHVPMLPWVSDNATAIARLKQLATAGVGRYYVHCYLGKDRIRIAHKTVVAFLPAAAVTNLPEIDEHSARRRLRDRGSLERGGVVEVTDGVFLIPFPTENELISFILPGTHGPVVSLLDPEVPDDRPWIEKEGALLAGNEIPLLSRPLPFVPFDPDRALEIAREVARMEPPVVVHAFLAIDSGRSPAAEAFLQAFRSNLPPLPPSLFAEPIADVTARVVAPNVAVGPRPAANQFGAYLHPRGVREVAFLGPADAVEAIEGRQASRLAGLGWHVLDPVDADAAVATVSSGGPWYLYGSVSRVIERRLTDELGPAIPTAMRWDPHAEAAPLGSPRTGLPAKLGQAVPDTRMIVLAGPLMLLWTAIAAAWVGWLRVRREVRAPFTRKVFHFLVFTTAAVVHITLGLAGVMLYGVIVTAAVLYAVVRGDDFPFYEALARPTDAPHRTLFIVLPLAATAVGGLASNLLFGGLAYVGYLVAGWGDAIAEPVGVAWGRHRYRVPGLGGVRVERSAEGSAAVLVVGTIAAACGLLIAGTALPTALAVGLACGIAGAVVEAISHHGLDNFTIQLAATATAWLLLS